MTYDACTLCPRRCGVDRRTALGFCRCPDKAIVAKTMLHKWEEPALAGNGGSGAVFFGGCTLGCVYCQNAVIADGEAGAEISIGRLAQIYSELQAKGALNINLVTPTHYAPHARVALDRARERGMDLPVVWNTSGYETVRAVRENRGYADVYLTDYKYASSDLAARYSKAPNYPQVALDALSAMVDEVGDPCFDEYEGDERMTRGVVVRHLMLPGALEDSKRVVQTVWEHFGSSVLLSIMNQYTPVLAESAKAGDAWACRELERCSELARRVPNEDYERLLDFADSLGIKDYFWQEGGAAEESFIPAFDLEGVLSE